MLRFEPPSLSVSLPLCPMALAMCFRCQKQVLPLLTWVLVVVDLDSRPSSGWVSVLLRLGSLDPPAQQLLLPLDLQLPLLVLLLPLHVPLGHDLVPLSSLLLVGINLLNLYSNFSHRRSHLDPLLLSGDGVHPL